MGPEEHGGHCELEFDGLTIPDDARLMNVGDGLKVTQIRLGTARLTHCMRWLGLAKRSLAIALDYVKVRENHGRKLADLDSVQGLLGDAALQIEIGRLLTMRAAVKLDAGDFARKEISMAKVVVADALQRAADTGIQLCGARGLLEGHRARVDLPLRAPGAPRRRRLRGAQGRPRELSARRRRRVLALGRAALTRRAP